MPHAASGRRLSRRALITDLGSAGIGLAILAACTGSSDDGSSDDGSSGTGTAGEGTSGTTAGDGSSPSSTAGATDAAGAATTTEDTSSTTADAGAGPLTWEQVSFGFVSAYVLLRGNEAAIVDTGVAGQSAAILAGLDLLGASWSDVAHVVLTHSHGDHVGGLAGVLAEAPGATVYAGAADLEQIAAAVPLQAVGDGDEVMGLGVVNTPGHTPGSISVFDTGTGLLVAGDAIVGVDGAIGGPDPAFTADMATATASLATLAALDPLIAAFGHGGPPVTMDVTAQLQALATG
jgi:glyoxylase-like metal-dependent hydrolase (beta-lactamase superfamily II)